MCSFPSPFSVSECGSAKWKEVVASTPARPAALPEECQVEFPLQRTDLGMPSVEKNNLHLTIED